MKPRTYVIGHKVNSLLSELSLSTCETWLLPPTCVLCMIRYLEESHGATTSNRRASEDAKYKDQEVPQVESSRSYSGRTSGRSPDIRRHQPEEDQREAEARRLYSGRTSGRPPDIRRPATGRTSGACPEIRRTLSREQKNRPLQPGHPARGPNLRLFVSRRTSGACLRTVNGPRAHVSLSLTPSRLRPIYTPPPPPS